MNVKRILVFICLLVALTLGQASAQENWVSVGFDTKGYEWLYDSNSVLDDGTGHFTVTFAQVHPDKKTWYKGDISILPMRRLYSLNRWEEHRKKNDKYTYWTYDYKLKSYGSNSMYSSIGDSIIKMKQGSY